MRTFVSSVLVAGALAASVLGCSGGTATAADPAATAAAAQSAPSKAPVAPQLKGHLRIIADALSDVPLRADQRTEIEQMAKDADARHAATATAHAQVLTALAAQVEAGKLDRAALQPTIDAAINAASSSHPADQAAFQRLHALLTPEQRAQFVDAVRARFKAKMGEWHDEHAQEHAEGHGAGHLDKWAAELKLTDDQKTQIANIFKAQMTGGHHEEMREAMKGMHERGKEVLDSFMTDNLVLPPQPDVKAKASAMVDHVFGVAQQVLPVLTPEQRSLAAAKLREKASGGEGDEGPM